MKRDYYLIFSIAVLAVICITGLKKYLTWKADFQRKAMVDGCHRGDVPSCVYTYRKIYQTDCVQDKDDFSCAQIGCFHATGYLGGVPDFQKAKTFFAQSPGKLSKTLLGLTEGALHRKMFDAEERVITTCAGIMKAK